MTKPRLALEVEDARWTDTLPNAAVLIEQAVSLALADTPTGGRTIEVGVRLVDDGTIQGLNRDWRGKDNADQRPVLSIRRCRPGHRSGFSLADR